MRYEIKYTNAMEKSVKKMRKRGKDLSKLEYILELLASGDSLPPKYKDHQLTGNFSGSKECHIESDWLLIYQIHDNTLILLALDTGSHSDLFR